MRKIFLLGLSLFCVFSSMALAADHNAQAVIHCTNNPCQGEDAILVTSLDTPLDFRCNASLTSKIPKNYKQAGTKYQWAASSGKITPRGNQCSWNHPKPGLQIIHITGSITLESTQSNGFLFSKPADIVVPFKASLKCVVPYQVDLTQTDNINGFKVGKFPDPNNLKEMREIDPKWARRIRNYPAYTAPTLFYKVTPETYTLKIFKNYALGEFDLDPRFSDLTYPRYITLDYDVLRKLELLKELMNAEGVPVTKFNILYGYRSMAYNLGSHNEDGDKTLKSSASMHMYGRALDIMVDEDRDLVLDDLNKDGKIDIQDARTLLTYVNQLDNRLQAQNSELFGGAGAYYHHDYWERGEYVQSPYVHFDIRNYANSRGNPVRWTGDDTIGVTKQRNPYRLKKAIPPHPFLAKQ